MTLVPLVSSGILLWSKLPEDMADILANNFGAFAEEVSKPNELKKRSFFFTTRVFLHDSN